jgi:NADH-quinone oxidoreductase subunit F
VADYAYEHDFEYTPHLKDKKEDKVAIIGSGPAGLSAAWDLAIDGYQVTVFESLPVAGGMMSVGIPEYRLPKKILNREIANVKKLGVTIKLNTRIEDPFSLLDQGYKAVLIAVGAHKGTKMQVPGEDLEGVMDAVDFLRPVNMGNYVHIGEKIAVVGGGNSAIDAARVAVRKGAKEVHVLYRRERADMPAEEEEVIAAEEEGVKLHFLVAPSRILSQDGKVNGIECLCMELKSFDASGRRTPEPVVGSEHVFDVDMVIRASGQHPDTSSMKLGLIRTDRSGRVIADKRTLATVEKGIFVAGDALSGPSTVIEAIAAGQRAASSIWNYLHGKELSPVVHRNGYQPIPISLTPPTDQETKVTPRVSFSEIPISDRRTSFAEVLADYKAQEAREEASRCLRCDLRDEEENES